MLNPCLQPCREDKGKIKKTLFIPPLLSSCGRIPFGIHFMPNGRKTILEANDHLYFLENLMLTTSWAIVFFGHIAHLPIRPTW